MPGLGFQRTHGALRLGFALACAGLLVCGRGAQAAAEDAATPGATTSGQPKPKKAPTNKSKPAKSNKSKSGKTTGKTTGKTKKLPDADATDADAQAKLKRRRIGATPAYVIGDSDPHLINESAPPLESFPGDSKAVKKAFAETRRDQLVDAEKAARDATSPDRWRTVLFMLRGLPERTDPEACFWRVLSFYRLGEIQRARVLRENCELPPKDSAALNAEDATASGVPKMGTVAVDDGFGPPPGGGTKTDASMTTPTPAVSPYTGPSPQRH
jgi:hypothetical protein